MMKKHCVPRLDEKTLAGTPRSKLLRKYLDAKNEVLRLKERMRVRDLKEIHLLSEIEQLQIENTRLLRLAFEYCKQSDDIDENEEGDWV